MNIVGIPEEKNETYRGVEMIACQNFTFIKCLVAFISVPYPLLCILFFLLPGTPSPPPTPLPSTLPTTRPPQPLLSPLIAGTLFILLFAAHLSYLRVVCMSFACPIWHYVSTQAMSSTFFLPSTVPYWTNTMVSFLWMTKKKKKKIDIKPIKPMRV